MENPPIFRLILHSDSRLANLVSTAEEEVERGRIAEASQHLLKANSIDQKNVSVLVKLAHTYLLMGNYDLSYTCYCKALSDTSCSLAEEVWFGLGDLYFKQAKLMNAETAYKNLIELNPNFEYISTAYLRLGIIYKKYAKPEKAIPYLKASISHKNLKPNQLNELLLTLASCFESLSNKKVASELYHEALKYIKNVKNMACVAWTHIRENRIDKAYTLITSASKICEQDSKEYYDIQYLLALAHNKAQKYTECEKILAKLLEIHPNEPYYLASYGIVEENMMKYSSALSYLWKSVVYLPERHDILFMIAQIYEKVAYINEALFLYKRITELFPWHQQAKTRLLEFQSGHRSPALPIDLLNLDITEFPFHKGAEISRNMMPNSQNNNGGFNMMNFMAMMNASNMQNNLAFMNYSQGDSLPQKRRSDLEVPLPYQRQANFK